MFELSFSDPHAQEIIKAAFPSAHSKRPVQVHSCETYHVSNYWSEGSRDYSVFVRLSDMSAIDTTALPSESRQQVNNPFNLAIADIKLTEGYAVVENCIFRGKDLGYRIYLHPDNILPLLPKVKENLPERDRSILNAIRTYKSGPYRQAELERFLFTDEDRTRLAKLGYLKVAKNGATSLTEKGRIASRE